MMARTIVIENDTIIDKTNVASSYSPSAMIDGFRQPYEEERRRKKKKYENKFFSCKSSCNFSLSIPRSRLLQKATKNL